MQNNCLRDTVLTMLNKKSEMDPASIAEDTKRMRFPSQTDGLTGRWMDGRAGGRARWNQYTSVSTLLKRGIKEVYITIKTSLEAIPK